MARADEDVAIEEGADRDFVPDRALGDGERIAGAGWTIEAVHTPGHTSNHLCFALCEEKALFTGDHVMSWSTSVVAPPDGDMQAYMESLAKLLTRKDRVLWPAHGGPVRAPAPFLRAFIAHREEREAAIAACLKRGIGRIPDMVARIYTDVDPLAPSRRRAHRACASHPHGGARPRGLRRKAQARLVLPRRLSFVTPCSTD